ncbi:MAG: hypothetical protein QOD41_3841 [Cryptosporangiaceae bacterium]|jgi:hypothetical protein|nr:hypothetical protein [Cryptosporangiaceae bacterium]
MIPKTRRRIGIAAASGALLLALGTATASGAEADQPVTAPSPSAGPTESPSATPSPSEYSLYAPNVVTLTFTIGESPEPVQRAVSLSCDPTAGTHPDPADACRILAAAHGDVASIPPANSLCTFEYAPVTVTLRGVWAGSLRSYTGTFANRCILLERTEGLFGF